MRTATFKGFDDWIEIFSAGRHTDSSGATADFTEQQLDELVSTHNAEHPAPLVIGHPKTDDPAYGWTAQLKRAGDKLLAKFSQVHDAVSNAAKQGSYRNRSIKIKQTDKGLKLVHVGLLGAVPPAVEGLKPIAFEGEGGQEFEFAWSDSYGWSTIARSLRSLRDFLISKFDQATADAALPSYNIESLEQMAADKQAQDLAEGPMFSQWNADRRKQLAKGEIKGAFAGPDETYPIASSADVGDAWGLAGKSKAPDSVRKKIISIAKEFGWTDGLPDTARAWAKDNSIEFSEQPDMKQFSQAELDAAVLAAKNESAAPLTAAQARVKELEFAQRRGSAKAEIDALVTAGKLTPAQAAGAAEFLAQLDADANEFEFSGADNKSAKAKPGAWFRGLLNALPKQIGVGPSGQEGVDRIDPNNANELAKRATEFQASELRAGRTITIAEAVNHVSKQARA